MNLLSEEEIKDHQYTITTGNGMPLLPDGRTYVRLENLLKAQAELTAREKDAEWRIALEIVHQQDEEEAKGMCDAKVEGIFVGIKNILHKNYPYQTHIWLKDLQALAERFGVK